MKLSGRFLQFDRCEVLIYFPLSYLNRFVGRAGQAAAFTTLYGTDEWRRAIDLQGAERQRFLLDLFQQQLVAQCGLTDVRSFEIVTATPNAGYDLVFGTRHELGLERMKEAMWTMDPVAGVRFVDSTSAQGTLFEPEPDTRALAQAFRERLRYSAVLDRGRGALHPHDGIPQEPCPAADVAAARGRRAARDRLDYSGAAARHLSGGKQRCGFSRDGRRPRHLVVKRLVEEAAAGLRGATAPLLEEERDTRRATCVPELSSPDGLHRPSSGTALASNDHPIDTRKAKTQAPRSALEKAPEQRLCADEADPRGNLAQDARRAR